MFARKHWPLEEAVGQRIATAIAPGERRWLTVVGVVGDARLFGPDVEPAPRIYAPYAQHDQLWQSWLTVVARLQAGFGPLQVEEGMRATLSDLDADLPPVGTGTVEQLYEFGTRPRVFAMTLAVAFALSALALCVVGLYGLVSYSVAGRRKEIGLRMALGAQRVGVVRAVVVRTIVFAAGGALVGLAVALVATRAIENMLFGVTSGDVPTYLATLSLVLLLTAAAATVPALRASQISPVQALSAE
jgi:predicted lysophospholipase L1 biosynthesis ABC-type transport system permease subunit